MLPSFLADRGTQASMVFIAVAGGGMTGLGLAWSRVAAAVGVYAQMPFLVSGAIGGVALAGASLGLLAVHSERRAAAADQLWLEEAIASASEFVDTLASTLEAGVTLHE